MNIKNGSVTIKFDNAKLKDTLSHLYNSDRGLKLGILEGATNADTDTNVAEYAFYNEFGTKNIPARPFMRTTINDKAEDWAKIIAYGLKGNLTTPNVVEKALGQVGAKGKADVQQTIEANKFEANAQSTIEAKAKKGGKRGNIPLKDSTDLFNAIDFEVTTSRGKSL